MEFKITLKGALYVALCETFPSENIDDKIEECYSRLCEMIGVEKHGN